MTEKNGAAKAAKQLVDMVKSEFARRQEERRPLERGWELNMNFLCGNQYCDVNSYGEIEEDAPGFFWQTRRGVNHIAPVLDMRRAKLRRLRPHPPVRAATHSDRAIRSRRISPPPPPRGPRGPPPPTPFGSVPIPPPRARSWPPLPAAPTWWCWRRPRTAGTR